jgi:siroheme synthase
VIVSQATGSQEQVRWSNVARLASEEKLPAPALLIVGRVASHEVAELSAQFWGTNRKDPDLRQTSVS